MFAMGIVRKEKHESVRRVREKEIQKKRELLLGFRSIFLYRIV
jgi:hypothetical protein